MKFYRKFITFVIYNRRAQRGNVLMCSSLKNRKSANVGQFYLFKSTIFYKVAPRKFHVFIDNARQRWPLKNLYLKTHQN